MLYLGIGNGGLADRAPVDNAGALVDQSFSYNFTNTSSTASEQPLSMVKRSLCQSAEEPIFFNWLMMRLPYSSFHS